MHSEAAVPITRSKEIIIKTLSGDFFIYIYFGFSLSKFEYGYAKLYAVGSAKVAEQR